jgi:hypothetical protein
MGAVESALMEATMIDAWERASECERAAEAASDPDQWAVLMHIRDLWITFANEATLMSGRLHIEMASPMQALQ